MANEIEIRNSRNGQWYWVNTAVNACKHISAFDKCVYGALASFDGCTEVRPSFETIAERSNVSLRQAKNSIKKLIKVGYIEKLQGGGRGKANVYNLLKCVKGCIFCTDYNKQCKSQPETVQITTVNGAQPAPQLDKELNKKNIYATPKVVAKEEPFNLEEEIEKLQTSKIEHIRIIGLYLEAKGYKPASAAQISSFIKRNSRAACVLRGYSFEELAQTMRALMRTDIRWTLETCGKFIDNPEEAKLLNKKL